MLSIPALLAVNHLLRGAPWACEQLAPFAGSVVRVSVPPVSALVRLEPDGTLAQASADAEAAATIRASAPTAARLFLLADAAARRDVIVEGDVALASALSGVLSNLRWDVEEDLSRVVGDIAAHRMVQAGSGVLQWQRRTATRLAQSLAEYWTEERPLLASREAVRDFVDAVAALRDDVERLDKRIERLASGSSAQRRG